MDIGEDTLNRIDVFSDTYKMTMSVAGPSRYRDAGRVEPIKETYRYAFQLVHNPYGAELPP